MEVSAQICAQLLHREDDLISYQEFLAVPLGYYTFQLSDVHSLTFIDNDGVLGGVIKGSSKLLEVNSGIGRLWLDMASSHIALMLARAEREANAADGPTRGMFDYLNRLKRNFSAPPMVP